MPSPRVQQQIDRLLDEAEQAMATTDWVTVRQRCEAALALDPDNEDARFYVDAADRAEGKAPEASDEVDPVPAASASTEHAAPEPAPRNASDITSFADGRYEVTEFLGEGGRKIVYLAKDTLLDRDVAFALIKTEGLDDSARERITREAQTMGRLGSHPNVVGVLDIGEHDAQPFVVIELLGGGDVEGMLEDAGGPLPLEQVLEIAKDSARGLEFIHSKSIVHRDMKPGNVWLTADGVAKIGDYGLALSGDKTRLTVEGTMVGTVDYMPPEQALGGEITPRSDLYSLGAMIYELVTGSVPFKGDRITEVISQHINTAPELPSLRGAEIPPALEELILRLMAKEPENRPASAAEVLQLLEGIDPKDTTPLDAEYLAQLAQGVFVGRSKELQELHQHFDEAFSGISRLVVLVGQPGIGKTRLARELETYARTRGAQVVWGRAPEGGGSPPYWLFQQGLRHYLEVQDEVVARNQLGEDAAVLAAIAPEIAARLPGVVATADPDEFTLHEALRRFFHRLGEQRPILVVLDDLHWADTESLAALQHISRDLERVPMMIVGTYRDTETSRGHPLAQALATFNREPNFARIAVRGLDREGVSEFIERSASFEPSREQLDLFMRQTDGNPFFLSETVAAMLEAGTLDERTYTLTTPDGVREALSRRVNELPEDAVELLKLAAIVGYDFDFATLSIISDYEDDRQVELIETALAERVISEDSRAGRYQFVYQPMQELLLDEMSSTRRIRLHGTIAEQLDQSFGPRAEEHASELARHYTESAALNAAHVEPALKYSMAAGEQAEAQQDWAMARHQYASVLQLVESQRPESDSLADVFAALGRVETRVNRQADAQVHIGRALDLLEDHAEPSVLARVALGAFFFANPLHSIDIAERALGSVAGRDGPGEAELLAWIASAFPASAKGEEAERRARQLADELALDSVKGTLEYRDAQLATLRGDLEAAERHGAAAVDLVPAGGLRAARARVSFALLPLWRGELESARLALEAITADISSEPQVLVTVQSVLGAIHLLRWERDAFDGLVNLRGRPQWNLDETWVPRRREIEGQVHAALALHERNSQGGHQSNVTRRIGAATRARLRLELGDGEGAAKEIASIDFEDEPVFASLAATADDAFTRFADPAELRNRLEQFRRFDDTVPVKATTYGSFDRTRATWAIALEEFEEAEGLARAGLEWTQRERCPVEEGRCHQLLADLLERRGEEREAAMHLDAAGDLFSEHGARLYLDQVLEKKDLLKA